MTKPPAKSFTYGALISWQPRITGLNGSKASHLNSLAFKQKRCYFWQERRDKTLNWRLLTCRASTRWMWLQIAAMSSKKTSHNKLPVKSWSSSREERFPHSGIIRCLLSQQAVKRSSSAIEKQPFKQRATSLVTRVLTTTWYDIFINKH